MPGHFGNQPRWNGFVLRTLAIVSVMCWYLFHCLPGVAEETPFGSLATDIPGLRSRIANPLEMLGLYGTSHEACHRHDIPALRVTGDANEEQILTAGRVWLFSLPIPVSSFDKFSPASFIELYKWIRNWFFTGLHWQSGNDARYSEWYVLHRSTGDVPEPSGRFGYHPASYGEPLDREPHSNLRKVHLLACYPLSRAVLYSYSHIILSPFCLAHRYSTSSRIQNERNPCWMCESNRKPFLSCSERWICTATIQPWCEMVAWLFVNSKFRKMS